MKPDGLCYHGIFYAPGYGARHTWSGLHVLAAKVFVTNQNVDEQVQSRQQAGQAELLLPIGMFMSLSVHELTYAHLVILAFNIRIGRYSS